METIHGFWKGPIDWDRPGGFRIEGGRRGIYLRQRLLLTRMPNRASTGDHHREDKQWDAGRINNAKIAEFPQLHYNCRQCSNRLQRREIDATVLHRNSAAVKHHLKRDFLFSHIKLSCCGRLCPKLRLQSDRPDSGSNLRGI